MCDLCSKDPKELRNARLSTIWYAERLEHMAALLRRLANGQARPHDPNNNGALTARVLIRYLVEEWL